MKGFIPTPIASYLIKVHSRCNMMCDYCYEYNCGNTSWKSKPREMTIEIFRRAILRIQEHARAHSLTDVFFSFHGGEPLLRKPDFFKEAVDIARTLLEPEVRVGLGMQSNGTLLSKEWVDLFCDLKIGYGISIDGPQHVHDRFRVYSNGEPTHADVLKGLQHLLTEKGRTIWGGILSVLNVEEDPIEILLYLASFNPPSIDFLEPHGSWVTIPPGKKSFHSTEYGDWLIKLFDYWFDSPLSAIPIRKFEEIIEHYFGGTGSVESFGIEPVNLITISTNGDYESVDCLKASKEDGHYLGLNVFDHSIDEVLSRPMIQIRQAGLAALADQCRTCDHVLICGGGYFPHRYSTERGYGNPTVYCADYRVLMEHIQDKVSGQIGGTKTKSCTL